MSSCEVVIERNPTITTEFADYHLVVLRVRVHVMDVVDEHYDSWDQLVPSVAAHRARLVKSQNKHSFFICPGNSSLSIQLGFS
jgi:hypothetical protein